MFNIKSNVIALYELFFEIILSLPRIPILNLLKSCILRLFGAEIGKRVVFYPNVKINPVSNKLKIGDDVDLAWGVIITTSGGVTIGDRTLIGYNTTILSSNHNIPENGGKVFNSGHTHKPVIISNDVWIGANCTILPGVKIGQGAIVAGGSVVTKEIKPFIIVAGVPATEIKKRL